MSASAFRPYAARAATPDADLGRQSIDDLDAAICTLARSLNAETYRLLVLVRTFDDPLLANCVRITVGRPSDNDLLLQAISGAERRDHA